MKYVVFLVVKALLVLNQSVVGLKPTGSFFLHILNTMG